MVLKFVICPSERGEGKVSEVFFECSGFNMNYVEQPLWPGQQNYSDFAHFSIRGAGQSHEMNIDCKNTSVYAMNDTGKTIDSYRWSETETGEIKRM